MEALKIKGSAIRDLRTEQKLTIRALAEKSNMTFSHLCDAENGRKELSTALLKSVLSALDVQFSDYYASVSNKHRRDEHDAEQRARQLQEQEAAGITSRWTARR